MFFKSVCGTYIFRGWTCAYTYVCMRCMCDYLTLNTYVCEFGGCESIEKYVVHLDINLNS